jgi:hypothetical protein
MALYGVGKRDGDDVLMIGVEHSLLAFGTKHAAEDFIDTLDEDGEWIVVPIDESMGHHVVVV